MKTLLIIDSNPVFTAPGFGDALKQVPFSMTLAVDAQRNCRQATQWSLPCRHSFEDWSDARAYDGTVTIMQPQAQPLYDGISPHYLLALFAGPEERDSRDIVRQTHRTDRPAVARCAGLRRRAGYTGRPPATPR